MAFEGFELSQIELGEVSLRVRHGGSGSRSSSTLRTRQRSNEALS